jgi:hypothetical protein
VNCGGQGAMRLASLVGREAGAVAESAKQSSIDRAYQGQGAIAHAENGPRTDRSRRL